MMKPKKEILSLCRTCKTCPVGEIDYEKSQILLSDKDQNLMRQGGLILKFEQLKEFYEKIYNKNDK